MIQKINFPAILTDNEENYFSYLQGVIESIDELASVMVTKSNDGYNFRISPSLPVYNQPLLKEILDFHKMLGIKLDLSKSIKTSTVISFKIKNP